jgi:hypothetical protein
MKRWFMTVSLVVLIMGTALAQQKPVPPPPKPGDDGPSLEITMKFLREKLNDAGPVTYLTYVHDNVNGGDFTNKFKYEISKVYADPGNCNIGFHWKTEREGAVTHDLDVEFSLKAVTEALVMTREQDLKESSVAAGHPELDARVDPSVFVLRVRKNSKGVNEFLFFDEQMANRVAKAMVHAVELCGGGSTPEPF